MAAIMADNRQNNESFLVGYIFWILMLLMLIAGFLISKYPDTLLIGITDGDLNSKIQRLDVAAIIMGVTLSIFSFSILIFGINACISRKCPASGIPMPFRVKTVYGKEAFYYGVILIIMALLSLYMAGMILWWDYGLAAI